MSLRAVSSAPPTPDVSSSRAGSRIACYIRRSLFISLALLLIFLSAAGVLFLSPPALEGMSAMVMPPQPGAVPWNGQDRITVVAMGLTQRTTEPARTDTLLVMDIDPKAHRINMLSVPRDLWVNIPGYGQGKLAIAYEIGGSKLAAYTLEHELGIPVDYTLAMTFRGFMNVVDAMGGVTVNVPHELKDPLYPCLVGNAYCPIDIKPGAQHMNGRTALEFVRERHAFAQQDLARVQDQQAFAAAVKHTVLLPTTWPRIPAILKAFKSSLISNMPWNALPEVGAQYVFPLTTINHSYINMSNGMVQSGWSSDGQSILEPTSPNVISSLVHRLFSDPTLAKQRAGVAVLNGTPTSGLASDVESTLQNLGFDTVMTGNADSSSVPRSQVIVNTAQHGDVGYTARRLQRIMNADLLYQSLPGQSAPIVVVVGRNFPGG